MRGTFAPFSQRHGAQHAASGNCGRIDSSVNCDEELPGCATPVGELHTDLRDRPERFFKAHRLLARHAVEHGPGFWIRFTVHYNLCFGTVLAVVGRAAPEAKRAQYLGIASAMGSAGQVVLPLLTAWLIEWLDWRLTLLVIAAALAPMALCIPLLKAKAPAAGGPAFASSPPVDPLGRTIGTAFGHGSYLMLAAGFFVCGFHLAFITAHLPTYVQNFCLSTGSAADLRALGLQALALAGLANIAGTLLAARLGSRFAKPHVLAAIYALRAVVILLFISLPLTPLSVMLFGLAMGLLWLSTVPLTSALVLVMFGPRAMGTLFGFVFLSHQLGSFAGVWLGGWIFDRTASYDLVWYLAIALGIASAAAHLAVREAPALRPGLAMGS